MVSSFIHSCWGFILDLLTRFVLWILSAGPVPIHVAFVMDGNRRFARSRGRPVMDGHLKGFDSLKNILELCLRLDIQCVSIYTFSIDNFNRPQEEVGALMNLARGRFRELAEKGELLDRYSVRVNILGKTSLLPTDVQQSVKEMQDLTRHNSKAILNVCMPYTSREEITSSVQTTVDQVQSVPLPIEDLSMESIESNLYTAQGSSPPLDILIRTSGVNRLSDFLLWQTTRSANIYFVDTFWPEFGLPQMVRVLLRWQRERWFSNDRLGRVSKKIS